MGYKCVGCDAEIHWDGSGLFSYTCACGSRIFYDEISGAVAIPVSLVMFIHRHQSLPHLDFLIGTDPSTTPVKEAIIAYLKALGSIWMKDCEQCKKDGTYQRVLDNEKAQLLFEADMIIKKHQGDK